MPKILERLIGQLQANGMPKSEAYGVATKHLQKAGVLQPGSEALTSKGKERQAMGASGRAVDRASKASGRPPSDYKYNRVTNRATLRK